MAISSLVPVTVGADSYSIVVPQPQYLYKVDQAYAAGVYQITTSPTTSQAIVTFGASTTSAQGTTISGSALLSVPTAGNLIFFYVDVNSNVTVKVEKVADIVTGSAATGTIDTVTSTGNYAYTGYVYVLMVGGGAGGSGGAKATNPYITSVPNASGYGGGGAKPVFRGPIYLNGTTAVTIGAGGTGGTNTGGGAGGGATTFGNLNAPGAGEGTSGNAPWGGDTNNTIPGGNAAFCDGCGSAGESGQTGTVNYAQFFNNTNGGGGGGGGRNGGAGGTGGGSGIGTGGTGASGNTAATAGTGYGSGGGGGKNNSSSVGNQGGSGAPGVVYVLKGIV